MRTKNINNQGHWNTKWLEEGKDTWRKYPQLFDAVIDFIRDGSKLIDLGCGNGWLLERIKNEKKDMELVGLDISTSAIMQLKEFWGIDGFVSTLPEIPHPILSNYFDYVVMSEIVEHVVDTKGLMNNAYRVCKPGGYLIVLVPADHSKKYKKFVAEMDSEHEHWFDKKKLGKLFKGKVTISKIINTNTRNGVESTGEYYLAISQK